MRTLRHRLLRQYGIEIELVIILPSLFNSVAIRPMPMVVMPGTASIRARHARHDDRVAGDDDTRHAHYIGCALSYASSRRLARCEGASSRYLFRQPPTAAHRHFMPSRLELSIRFKPAFAHAGRK